VRIVVSAGEAPAGTAGSGTDNVNQEDEMPTVSTPNLTLSESDGMVTIRVQYTATFDRFDRELTALGRRYHSHVTVHGWDGGPELGAAIDDAEFDRVDFAVTVGTTDQPFPQNVTKTVPRSVLQEDPTGNPDELKANVRIHSNQLVPEWTEDAISDQETLTSAP
jgi:hypothetical protein